MSIVERAGGSWSPAGWGLFVAALLLPYVVFSTPEGPAIWFLCICLLFVWWFIDAMSQMTPAWMFVVGIIMFAFGVLVRIMLIACWAIYWTKVRD